MPIPDYQTAMLPLLRLASDGKEHSLREAADVIASQFKLSDEERNQLLPSGRQRTLDNRIGWSKTYLLKAGLLDKKGRGRFGITPRGRDVFAKNPNSLSLKELEQFPEFSEFIDPKADGRAIDQVLATSLRSKTPEEDLDAGYQALRARLAEELLERVKANTPQFFETLVVDLLVAMGYGGSREDASQVVGRSGDEGIDGIIKEDKLGLDVVYVQAKRWQSQIGRPVVQAFAGALEGQRARKGVMISTSTFSGDARDYVKGIDKKIVLIDGAELATLMIEHGVGVTNVITYKVKRIDADYFGEEE